MVIFSFTNSCIYCSNLLLYTSQIFVKFPLLEGIWLLSLGPWAQDVIVTYLLANIFLKYL